MTTYDFEGGTAGNAANSTTAGCFISQGTGNSIVFGAPALSGSLDLVMTVGTTTTSAVGFFATGITSAVGTTFGTPSAGNSGLVCILVPVGGFRSTSGYTASTAIVQFYTGDPATSTICRIKASDKPGGTGAQALIFTNATDTSAVTILADLTPYEGTWVALRWQMNTGTSSSNGSMTVRFYANEFALGTDTATSSGTSSAYNLGSAGTAVTVNRIHVGFLTTQFSAPGGPMRIGYANIIPSTSLTWVAGPSEPSAPTVDAGPDQRVQEGTTVTLAGSATIGSGGGAITSTTWTCTDKPTGAPNPSFTAGNLATTVTGLIHGTVDNRPYIFQLGATQSGGGGLTATPDTMSIFVYPLPGAAVLPYSVTKGPGVTREGTATSDIIAITDSSAATGLLSPDNPAGVTTTIVWGQAAPGPLNFAFDGYWDGDANPIDRVVNHYENNGTTLLDGPYTEDLTNVNTSFPAGLDTAAMSQIGTALANRCFLVTKYTDTMA